METNSSLQSNKPCKLVKIDGCFSLYDKAKAIKDFFINYYSKEEVLENKIVVLYGEWGSGKSSVVEHLRDEFNEASFKTIYFPAWEHEKDDNLTFSLFDIIAADVTDKEKIKGFFKAGYSILKGVAKSVELNAGFFNFKPKNILEEYENYYKSKNNQKSLFCKEKEEFKEKFIEIENSLLDKKINEKIIIFIDDLDRCEPENVLDLIATIKHFMTLGKKTIFFFALDKKAISEAVKVKYGNYINADAYMEKIFDISFLMPAFSEIKTLLRIVFKEEKYNDNSLKGIIDFLKKIKFTNPRHIKKVLNKYEVSKVFSSNENKNSFTIAQGCTIFDIFWLYMIILYEFFPEKFEEIEDYENKISSYKTLYYEHCNNHLRNINSKEANANSKILSERTKMLESFKDNVVLFDFYKKSVKSLKSIKIDSQSFFVQFFTPNSKYFKIINTGFSADLFLSMFQYEGNEVHIDFCHWLLENKDFIFASDAEFSVYDLFDMAKKFL